MKLDTLLQAYAKRSDEPDYLLTVTAQNTEISPSELFIAYDYPIEDEERYATTLTTLGLSTHTMAAPCETAELVLAIDGQKSQAEYDALGSALAQLIWDQLAAKKSFAPNMIIRDVSLPFFKKMKHLLVLDWGHSDPAWLETEPPVRLLESIPLYKSEADLLESIPKHIRTPLFVQTKGNWDAPDRAPIDLITQATLHLWQKIEKWYERQAKATYNQLQPGASAADVKKLEKKINLELPLDLKAALMTHDGAVNFHSYKYLSTEGIATVWQMMKELLEEGEFTGQAPDAQNAHAIQKTWWDLRWIPFAKDSGGNLLCVDMMPGPEGTIGQVIQWEQWQGPSAPKATSFFEWLWEYQQALYQNRYSVDGEGFIS